MKARGLKLIHEAHRRINELEAKEESPHPVIKWIENSERIIQCHFVKRERVCNPLIGAYTPKARTVRHYEMKRSHLTTLYHSQPIPERSDMSNSRPRILAIDDTLANLLTLGKALAPSFDMQVATSGAMGLALALETPPDLILLDVMMPEMDGHETCRRIMAEPRLQTIPVVFLTALTSVKDEILGLSLGAADYITKPINVELARHRIHNLLDRERLRKDVETQRDLLAVQIVERKQAEEDLRQSEERLSRAELASKSGNWELHVDTHEIIASAGAARIYGITKGQYEFALVQNAVLPEYRPLLDAAMSDLIEQSKPYDVEFKIKTLDTEEIKDIHSTATLDPEKRVVFEVIHDVTERRRLQRALAQEESRRRIVLEQSQDGIALLHRDGSLVEWNPAFAKMLGYSVEELGRINVKDWDIKLGNSRIEEITYHLGMEHLNIETQHWRKDGTIYDVEISISGVEWAGHNYLFCLHKDITIRKQSEIALRDSEARFRTIIEVSPIPYALNDDLQNVTYLNASFIKTYGYTVDDIPHLSDWWSKAYPDHEYRQEIVATWRSHMEKAERESQPFEPVEAEIVCKNGEKRIALVAAAPLNESLQGLHVVSFFDITARKQAEEEHRLAATVFSHAREGILIASSDGTILDVNQMFSQITGYRRDEVVGKTPHVLSSGRHEKSFYVAMWRDLRENGNWAGEIWNRRKDGEIFPEMLTISAVRDPQGETQQYVALFADITEVKNHEYQLERMAHYDVLTNLPNRALLADRLQQAMSQTARRKNIVTVCYLDLDGFKAINDKYGHEVGDQLLVALAALMKQALRETDTLARIGGDEFVAVLTDLADEESSLLTIERLIRTACQPVQLGDQVVQVSASLGTTFYPQADAVDADQLLRQADFAMYQAKLAGKNRYCAFEERMPSVCYKSRK